MVRLSFFIASTFALATFLVPAAYACESECRIYPVKFLVEKYTAMIEERLASLPSNDRNRVQGKTNAALSKLKGRGGTIDSAIFSVFHSTCQAKPPHRSPDELCGSAKSIACFAPWDHRNSVLNSVHQSVVKVLENSFKDENADVQQALVIDVQNACPSHCNAWVEPFQIMMLQWEQREHRKAYGDRTPNCSNGRLGY
ncbi:hypothetical protein EMPS_03725 [Entomortierella parvispora]|uniref:Uncharacterized protein n=1 Tax=Entomortierella parvispora TaxID=205924 RepID=A0A9P3H7D2_9FUNG|nr:hypothetical protein EMPS_03725 [Entomortierella parvispora]